LTRLGLRTRRGSKVSSQTFDALLENQLYIGIIDVPEYGVRSRRGDFEPLIDQKLFYRVQGILQKRIRSIAPPQRSRPDFRLRAFVRCHACGRPLTGSWSKGRNGRFAYYHCRGGECRDINISKAKLEGLFVDELTRLQPTAGYMRLVKERVVQAWDRAKSDLTEKAEAVERRIKTIRQRIDRLDNAFLYEQSIDIDTYDRHKERLNEELTLARIDRHATELEEMDVEGILGFAERVLPRAADLWVQASLEQRQRFQQLFFPNGIAFDGNRFVGTGATAPAFSYLREIRTKNEEVVDLTGIEPVTS
jgi:site-specific DNA recombinase